MNNFRKKFPSQYQGLELFPGYLQSWSIAKPKII